MVNIFLPNHLSGPSSSDEEVFFDHHRRLDKSEKTWISVLTRTESGLVLLGECGLELGHQDLILVILIKKRVVFRQVWVALL